MQEIKELQTARKSKQLALSVAQRTHPGLWLACGLCLYLILSTIFTTKQSVLAAQNSSYGTFSSRWQLFSRQLHSQFGTIVAFFIAPITSVTMPIYRVPQMADIQLSSQALRDRLMQVVLLNTTQTTSRLLSGLVLGETDRFTREEVQILKVTGMLHVAAASGFNIGLVLLLLRSCVDKPFMQRLGKRVSSSILFIGMWVYAWLVGLEAPVVRAAGMGSVSLLLSLVLGRKTSVPHLLLGVVLCMLLSNWRYCTQLSFLLTVAATVGIAVFPLRSPKVLVHEVELVSDVGASVRFTARWFSSLVLGYVRDAWWLSLSASLWTGPLLLWFLGQFSPVSVVANIAVGWLVPQLTVGMGALLLVLLGLRTSIVGAWLLQPILAVLEVAGVAGTMLFWKILHFFELLPLGTLTLNELSAKILAVIWFLSLVVRQSIRIRRLSLSRSAYGIREKAVWLQE